MKKKSSTIGLFDAKTHLSELLADVERGNTVTITKRGKPVAKLVPYQPEQTLSRKDTLKKLEVIRSSVKGSVNIKEYINEGRKY